MAHWVKLFRIKQPASRLTRLRFQPRSAAGSWRSRRVAHAYPTKKACSQARSNLAFIQSSIKWYLSVFFMSKWSKWSCVKWSYTLYVQLLLWRTPSGHNLVSMMWRVRNDGICVQKLFFARSSNSVHNNKVSIRGKSSALRDSQRPKDCSLIPFKNSPFLSRRSHLFRSPNELIFSPVYSSLPNERIKAENL